MSNTRIVSYYGKSTPSGNATFGLTVQTNDSVPTMIQTTYQPVAVGVTGGGGTAGALANIQSQRFVMNYSNTATAPATIAASTISNILAANVTLISGRMYQYNATLTITVVDGTTSCSGYYLLQTGARDSTLIGSGAYLITALIKDPSINNYIADTDITVTVNSNNFVINITTVAPIATSLNAIADVTVSSVQYV